MTDEELDTLLDVIDVLEAGRARLRVNGSTGGSLFEAVTESLVMLRTLAPDEDDE